MGSKLEARPDTPTQEEDEPLASETAALADEHRVDTANGEVQTKPLEAEEDRPKVKPRLRIPKTICLYMCFLAAGFATNVLGPTLTNMSVFLGTTMDSIVAAFSGAIVGWIGGSVIAGALYERFNPEIQLTLAALVITVCTALAPWTGNLWSFVAIMTVQGLGAGYIDAGGQPYGLRLWDGSKWKNPVMQATAVFTSIGSSGGPLIVSPFLIDVGDLDEANTTTTSPANDTPEGVTELYSNATTPAPFDPDSMIVGYAYVTLSIYMFVAMCCMFGVFLVNGPYCKSKVGAKEVSKEEEHPSDLTFKISIYVLLYLFFVLLMWISGMGHLIPAVVTEGLGWKVQAGSWIASLFWGMLGVGRVVGIALSTVMSPAQMLLMDTALAVFALILMSIVPLTSDVIMWIAAALAGFATASEFVSAVLWVSKYVRFTGVTAAVCICGMGTGGIAGVQVAGYFFGRDMYLAVIYCSLIATIIHLCLFVFMHFFAEIYYKRLKKRAEEDKNKEPTETELKPLKQSEVDNAENIAENA